MGSFGPSLQSIDSANGDETSTSGLSRDQKTEFFWNKISLEQPTVPCSGESIFLTQLWVSGNHEPREELHQSNSSQSVTTGFESRSENIILYNQETTYRVIAALKHITFREHYVLVQFWSARVVGKHHLLTTIDQPFGLGAVVEKLCVYRRDSEHNAYFVDKDLEEEDRSPPVRVFRRGLPEWTPDITNYNPKDFPLYKSAISCNLHGYLALPVVDPTTGLCVGVLELLMSSKYTSFAFEVQQVHRALKTENLTSPQVFDCPTSKVPNERRPDELHKILGILESVSDIHNLPLAQTWAMSPTSSFVSHKNVIEKSCSSFDSRCIGKSCMSTTGLPFYVRDLGKWQFMEACRLQHVDRSSSFVGQALLSHGWRYCQDVTQLGEEEYPLVHYARVSRLTSCFTIFLHSFEDDYVLEFFLVLDNKDSTPVMSLVQTLKQIVDVASGFELGDISTVELIGPPRDVSYLSSSINPHAIQISSTTMANTITFDKGLSDSKSFLSNVSKTDPVKVPSQWSSTQNHSNKQCGINTESLARNDVISGNINVFGSMQMDNSISNPNGSTMKMNGITEVRTKNSRLKQGRKCKIDSLTMKLLEQHIEKPIGQAAVSLGVSRSTLKRFCREHGISSWPVPKRSKKAGYVIDPKLSEELCSEKHMQTSSSPSNTISHNNFSIYQITLLIVSLRRWRNKCSNRHPIGNPDFCMNTGKHEHTTNILNPNLNVDEQLSDSSFVHTSTKKSVINVSNVGMLIVKVTFNDDMIKFRFPVSSGLLELEIEVGRRVHVKGKRLIIKYKDEDGDFVRVTCDADLHAIPEFLASNSTIKLYAQLADD